MTKRVEEVLSKLSPQQLDELLADAAKKASSPRPRGQKLRLDWARCIDSEHTSGLDAQRSAMNGWSRSIERSLDE